MGCRTSITIMWTQKKKKKKEEEENLEELKNPQPKEPQIFTTNLHPHLQPIT